MPSSCRCKAVARTSQAEEDEIALMLAGQYVDQARQLLADHLAKIARRKSQGKETTEAESMLRSVEAFLVVLQPTYGCLCESKSPTSIEISGPAYAKIRSFPDTLSAGWRNCDDLDLEVVKPAHTLHPWAHADGWPPSPDTASHPLTRGPQAEATTCRSPGTIECPGSFLFLVSRTPHFALNVMRVLAQRLRSANRVVY